ncbi:hypothetical protein GCM10017687_85190 [Streptomyces echinatus]
MGRTSTPPTRPAQPTGHGTWPDRMKSSLASDEDITREADATVAGTFTDQGEPVATTPPPPGRILDPTKLR